MAVATAVDRASIRRLGALAALALSVCALSVESAKAGPLGLLPTCDLPVSQPFKPWGDNARYSLVPGGSFESGSPSWALSGGANVVDGNEPFYVRGAGDARSLLLPSGSSATTPGTCFVLGDWHLRFFVANPGSQSAKLRVTVVVRGLLGILSVLDGGTVAADGEWQPSPRVGLLVSNLTSPLIGAISFRFTPVGSGAAFRIDDVYLDPWKSS
jgi:hypothetical protein